MSLSYVEFNTFLQSLHVRQVRIKFSLESGNLEYCVKFWAAWYRRDMELPERVQ